MPEAVDRIAETFVEMLGWAPAPASGPSGENPATVNVGADSLDALVAAPRLDDVRWWRAIAEAWSAAGSDVLAAWCARSARDLIIGGAVADPADIAALARLTASLRARAGATGRRPRWQVPADRPNGKRERIAAALGGDDPSALRMRDLHSQIVTAVWMAQGQFTDGLANGFHAIGQHRVVVEMVLAEISRHGLPQLLTSRQDLLLWAGLSLAKAGDRTSAYACLRIALRRARIPAPQKTPEGQPTADPNSLHTQAVTTVAGLLAESSALGSPNGALRIAVGGLALGHWLATNSMVGLFPQFVTSVMGTPFGRRVGPAVHRQMQWMAAHHGWLERIDRTQSACDVEWAQPVTPDEYAGPPPPQRRAASPGTPPAPVRPRRRVSRADPTHPGPSVVVPIGLRTDGGEATLSVRPGQRIALLGPPFDAAVVGSIGAWLAADGHAVVVIRPSDVITSAAETGWRSVGGIGSRTADLPTVVRKLVQSPRMRTMMSSGLVAGLPRCDDPQAAACLATLLDTLQMHSVGAFSDDCDEATLDLACQVVSATAGLEYASVLDLRRAARLVEYLVSALDALRTGLTVQYTGSDADVKETVVCLELPDNPAAAAVRLAAFVGSLVRSPQPDRPIEPDDDFVITPVKREEEADAALIEAARAAATSIPFTDLPLADGTVGDDNGDDGDEAIPDPWGDCGVTGLSEPVAVTVLVCAYHDVVWDGVLHWLGELAPQHTLVVAAQRPTLTAVAALTRFTDVLAGALQTGFAGLVEIAVGAVVPALAEGGTTDDRTAVTVRGDAGPSGPTIIWPPDPKGVDRHGA